MSMQALFALLDAEAAVPNQDAVEGDVFGAFEAEAEERASCEATDLEERAAIQADVLEKDYDRESGVIMTKETVPAETPSDPVMEVKAEESVKAADEATLIAQFQMPDDTSYRHKGERFQLIFQGVATHCAHCGFKLTDSISMERCLGPVCSKRGYLEDPKEADEVGAIFALAEFPTLAQYVTDVYKPLGVRKMMNFLVRICALNRRSPVHAACTDAIEQLGYKTLASLLRESIAVVEVNPSTAHAGSVKVWVKKSEWSWGWTNALRAINGAHFSRAEKGTIVPDQQKAAVWELIKKYYAGFYCKTAKGCVKIPALPPVPTPHVR